MRSSDCVHREDDGTSGFRNLHFRAGTVHITEHDGVRGEMSGVVIELAAMLIHELLELSAITHSGGTATGDGDMATLDERDDVRTISDCFHSRFHRRGLLNGFQRLVETLELIVSISCSDHNPFPFIMESNVFVWFLVFVC